jgi:hypothetical protein
MTIIRPGSNDPADAVAGPGPERRRPRAAGDAAWSVARCQGQVKRQGGGSGWWCSVARRVRRQGRATGRPRSEGGGGRCPAPCSGPAAAPLLPWACVWACTLALVLPPGSGRRGHGCGAASGRGEGESGRTPHGGCGALGAALRVWPSKGGGQDARAGRSAKSRIRGEAGPMVTHRPRLMFIYQMFTVYPLIEGFLGQFHYIDYTPIS